MAKSSAKSPRRRKQSPPQTEVFAVAQSGGASRRQWTAIRSLGPEVLARALDEYDYGNLAPAVGLWEVMSKRDPVLVSVRAKRDGAVSRRPWEVLELDGLTPAESRRAARHKKALTWFYNNLSCVNAFDRNFRGGMSYLLRTMMTAVSYGYAAHHIVWRPSQGGLSATLEYVPAQWFENRTGSLRYLPPGDYRMEGDELDPSEWITTAADGLMIAGSVAYTLKHCSQQDWLAYSDKFGMPGIVGKTSAKAGSPEAKAMMEAVARFGHDWATVITGDDGSGKIDLIEAKASGSLPMPAMIESCDRAMSILYRGADLSTMSRGTGDGTGVSLQAQGEEDLLVADAELLSGVLNTQLDPLIIKYALGDDAPLAYIKITVPQRDQTERDLKIDGQLIGWGLPLAQDAIAERYNRTLAEPGETVAGDGTVVAAANERTIREVPLRTLVNGTVEDDPDIGEFLGRARDRFVQAQAIDLRPLAEAIAAVVEDEERDLTDALRALDARLPEIADQVFDSTRGVDALEEIIAAALVSGLAAAEPAAVNANPYRKRNGRFGSKSDYDFLVGAVGGWDEFDLPPATEMPTRPRPQLRESAESTMERLRRGEEVTDPTGKTVRFGDIAFEHMAGKADGPDARRSEFLGSAMDTVSHPMEVWQVTDGKETGRLYYISRYDHVDKRKGGFLVVTVPPENNTAEVLTYMPQKIRELNKKRQGRLLHVGYGKHDKGG